MLIRSISADAPTNRHLRLLEQISRETRVLSPTSFTHAELGRRKIPTAKGNAESSAALTQAITDLIYVRYYLDDPRALAKLRARTADTVPIPLREDVRFGYQLRQSNTGRGYFDPGWTVVETPPAPNGSYAVRKGRLTLSVTTAQIAAATGDTLTNGSAVAVRFPKDRPYAMPGYYAAVSSAGPPPREAPLLRWYVHLRPEAAPRLVERVTRGLGEAAVPFVLKVLNHPDAYTRPDAAVLYLPRAMFAPTLDGVLAAYRAVAGSVRPRVPAFTRRVLPGLALAEEPTRTTPRLSFGQHRSRLVARGLIDAAVRGGRTPTARLDAILGVFASERINLDAPHLNPDSSDYDITAASPGGFQ